MHVLETLPPCDAATKRDHFYQVLDFLSFKNCFLFACEMEEGP